MLTGSGRLDSVSEAIYQFREVEQIVGWTREEAARQGFTAPENFAHDEHWWKAESDIQQAVDEGDYIKTRDLSRAYVVRAVNYCRTWLERQRAKREKGTDAKGKTQ